MSGSGSLRLGVCIGLLLALTFHARAEDEIGVAAELADADRALNTAYKAALDAQPPKGQAQLRAAQRAWLDFYKKHRLAVNAFTDGDRRILLRFAVDELKERCAELKQSAAESKGSAADLRRADGALNEAYKAALAKRDEYTQSLLREAQRAWVAFRDAHARANPGAPQGAAAHVTAFRAGQLRKIPLAARKPSETDETPERSYVEPTPDPTVPNPFEHAR